MPRIDIGLGGITFGLDLNNDLNNLIKKVFSDNGKISKHLCANCEKDYLEIFKSRQGLFQNMCKFNTDNKDTPVDEHHEFINYITDYQLHKAILVNRNDKTNQNYQDIKY